MKSRNIYTLSYPLAIIFISSIPGNTLYQLSIPEIIGIDKFFHIFEYSIFGLLMINYFKDKIESPYFLTLVISVFFSFCDELYQSTVFGRSSSIFDIVADLIGISFGSLASYYLFSMKNDK